MALTFLAYAEFWPNTFPSGKEKTMYISRGETYSQVIDSLAEQGIIRDRVLFQLVSKLHGGVGRVMVGKYVIKSGTSNYGILSTIRNGHGAVLIPVTIREGLTLRRQARVLEKTLGIDSTRFVDYASDSSVAHALGIDAGTLEGFLMPETYSFPWQPDEHDVVRFMVETFHHFYRDSLSLQANELGYSMRQIVTMASIVEGESRLETERPIIAGVYYNRLKLGMRLEADPTIEYALEGGPRRLYYADLKLASEYNTYQHSGLPPGPINNPGRASILAALWPTHHQYLFFVANGHGGHAFSVTYEEHLRNARAAKRLRELAHR